MGKKLYPSNVLKEAIRAQVAWKQIDEGLSFGSMNIEGLAAVIENIYQSQQELIGLKTQLREAHNRRDELYLTAWDQIKRMRAGIKGLYGDDSSEYELTGCTPRSKRKQARRVRVVEARAMNREAE